ncbi:MAG: hypothetical protein E7593_02680 [Ruminococcaceae bacterium]|nr:hypothetical protein [Oscillospiraceae bacterium]
MCNSIETTNYREQLEKDGLLVNRPFGISMRPMLKQGRDTIVVEKIKQKPKENDVVLYQRSKNKYVLHRVIKVTDDGYIIRGDNCIRNEYDITDKHIIGVLTAFYRKDKYIDCNTSRGYKLYVFWWRKTFFIRVVFMFAFSCIRRILSKVKRSLIKTKKPS